MTFCPPQMVPTSLARSRAHRIHKTFASQKSRGRHTTLPPFAIQHLDSILSHSQEEPSISQYLDTVLSHSQGPSAIQHLDTTLSRSQEPPNQLQEINKDSIPMFGCIAAGRWVQTDMQTINETNFTFTLPNGRSVNHITIFILPGVSIPETHVATVHVRFPNSPDFKILGGISNTKPSAIFRLRGMLDPNSQLMLGAEDWNVVIGISIQEIAVAQAALAQLPAAGTGEATGASSGALVPASAVQKVAAMGTLQLARKIISNAFNYLGSFSKNVGGEEVVPLAAFQEWWKKFEKKVEYDPSFLERPEE